MITEISGRDTHTHTRTHARTHARTQLHLYRIALILVDGTSKGIRNRACVISYALANP